MAIRNVSVTTSAKLVPGTDGGGFPSDVTVVNTGSATAYVDSDQPDSTTAGQPITAGSSLVWQAGQPLWTVAPSATTLTISQNAGALFDAGAIASQIIAQGLTANAIATAITGGNILSPANIAAQINVAGVPAIEQAAALYDNSAGIVVGSNAGMNNVGPLNVTKYQSVKLWAQEFHTLAATTNAREITLLWFLDAGATKQIGQDAFDVPSGQVLVQVPCRAPFLVVAFNTISVASTSSQVIVGSYRPVERMGFKVITNDLTGSSGQLGSQYGINGVFSVSSNTIPTASVTVEYPCMPAGPAVFAGNFASIPNGACELRLTTMLGGFVIASINLATSASRVTFLQSVYLPFAPVAVRISPTAGATAQMNANLSLTNTGF